uniref:Uncharacterized protein n=1 Tax=Strongyloides papillosus TaxID=174720 RepID=A0A0N5CBW1_STREA
MPKEVKRKRTHTESNDGESNDDRENQICEVINSNSNNSSNPTEFTTNNPRKYGTSNFDKHLRNVHKLSIVQSKESVPNKITTFFKVKKEEKKDFDKKSIALNFIKMNTCYRIFSNKWFKFFNNSQPSASTVQLYVKDLANEAFAKLQDGLEDYKFVLSFDGYKFQQRKMLPVVIFKSNGFDVEKWETVVFPVSSKSTDIAAAISNEINKVPFLSKLYNKLIVVKVYVVKFN